MKPKVSVLITFYNQQDYVDKALKSVFDQNFEYDFEVLVGDDGSSDKTCSIVNEWIQKYPNQIRLFVMERTPGKVIAGFRASRNRLNLLKYVEGEYFIFLDGDDYFSDNNKLKKQLAILEDKNNKDCVACAHNITSLYPDGSTRLNTDATLKEGKYIIEEYWKKTYFHTDTLLVRSSVISTIPVELLENNFNDNLITYSVFQQGKVYYFPESMAVYLQTGDGVWTKGNVVVNLVRNLFMFDLCNIMNPKLKKATVKRLGGNFYRIFQVRNKINASELEILSKEAEDKKLVNSYKWIHYNELSQIDRLLLCVKAISCAVLSKIV